jgi:hypothetical protein
MDIDPMEACLNMLLTAVVTLGAAFLGAGYAFRLNDNANARQTVQGQVAAVNKALFVLVRQFNSLRAIQNQIINPSRADLTRFINLRPVLPMSVVSPKLDVDSLSFLLETECRGLLMELMIEQERFETSVQAINERSRLHIEVLQPRMAAGGIMEGVDYPAEKVIEILSKPLVLHMQRATDAAIQHVDDTVNSNLAFAKRFHKEMKVLFPKYRIIHFEPMEPSNPTVNTDAAR